jgi:hypothetical protein
MWKTFEYVAGMVISLSSILSRKWARKQTRRGSSRQSAKRMLAKAIFMFCGVNYE